MKAKWIKNYLDFAMSTEAGEFQVCLIRRQWLYPLRLESVWIPTGWARLGVLALCYPSLLIGETLLVLTNKQFIGYQLPMETLQRHSNCYNSERMLSATGNPLKFTKLLPLLTQINCRWTKLYHIQHSDQNTETKEEFRDDSVGIL